MIRSLFVLLVAALSGSLHAQGVSLPDAERIELENGTVIYPVGRETNSSEE